MNIIEHTLQYNKILGNIFNSKINNDKLYEIEGTPCDQKQYLGEIYDNINKRCDIIIIHSIFRDNIHFQLEQPKYHFDIINNTKSKMTEITYNNIKDYMTNNNALINYWLDIKILHYCIYERNNELEIRFKHNVYYGLDQRNNILTNEYRLKLKLTQNTENKYEFHIFPDKNKYNNYKYNIIYVYKQNINFLLIIDRCDKKYKIKHFNSIKTFEDVYYFIFKILNINNEEFEMFLYMSNYFNNILNLTNEIVNIINCYDVNILKTYDNYELII